MRSRHRQIIPADSTTRVVIETSALAQSIKAAALFARDSANAVYLNVRYLADVLAVIDAPQVALEFVSPSKPAVLKPVGHSDYLYVAMPMYINR